MSRMPFVWNRFGEFEDFSSLLFSIYSQCIFNEKKSIYKTTLCWTVSRIVKCIIICFQKIYFFKEIHFEFIPKKKLYNSADCLAKFVFKKIERRLSLQNCGFSENENSEHFLDVILGYESRLNKENKWKILSQFYQPDYIHQSAWLHYVFTPRNNIV